ncbi:MAG: thioredoxin [Clostridia bacterium]|nr:thioredoxin [Bacillota bacterium]MBO2521572.1 thioredoxin [Bacillota bacterium]
MAKEVTDQTFAEEVLQHQGVALVDFWAPWCGPCRRIGPIVEELAQEYEGRAKILKMNVDENQKTPMEYGIMGIPTLLIFKNGELVDTMVGLQSKDTLVRRLEAALQ